MAESVASLVERLRRRADEVDADIAWDMREAASRLSSPEPKEPPLMTWMTTDDPVKRDAAYLRMYAEHARNGTDLTWDIPNTRARTLSDIADRMEFRLSSPEGTRGEWLSRLRTLRGNVVQMNDNPGSEVWSMLVDVMQEIDTLFPELSSPSSAPAATPAPIEWEDVVEFAKWADHHPTCKRVTDADDCSCGLSEHWGVLKVKFAAGVSAATPAPELDAQVDKALQDAIDATKDLRDQELAVESGPWPDLRMKSPKGMSVDETFRWLVERSNRLAELEAAATPAPSIEVSEIREGEENDGPLESTDLFVEHASLSLLVNVLAGEHFTYSARFDGKALSNGTVGAAAERPAPTWQPIDSAPKDGTQVLLAYEHFDKYPVTGRYERGEWCPCGIWTKNEPIAWQPLPSLPAAPRPGRCANNMHNWPSTPQAGDPCDCGKMKWLSPI